MPYCARYQYDCAGCTEYCIRSFEALYNAGVNQEFALKCAQLCPEFTEEIVAIITSAQARIDNIQHLQVINQLLNELPLHYSDKEEVESEIEFGWLRNYWELLIQFSLPLILQHVNQLASTYG